MADLKFTVDTSSLVDAGKKLDDFQKKLNNTAPVLKMVQAVSTVENNLKSLMGVYDKGKITQEVYRKAVREQREALERLGLTTAQAAKRISDFNKALRAEQAAAKAAQDARDLARATEEAALAAQKAAERQHQLRLRYQEGYAAFAKARTEMRGLREAMRAGIITADQYRERVRLLREEMSRAGDAAQGAGRRMSRTGVVFQQAGYQIGDFAVQVQSGTHYMVALGQQLTQLVGVGAMLARSTKWIAAFSALGIIVPITTAIVGAYMRANEAAKDTKKSTDALSDSHKTLKESLEASQVPLDELIQKYGVYGREIQAVRLAKLQDQADKATQALQENSSKVQGFAQDTLNATENAAIGISRLGLQLGIKREGGRGQKYTEEQKEALEKLKTAFEELASAKTPEDQLEALQKVNSILQGFGKNIEALDISNFSDSVEAVRLLEIALRDAKAELNGMSTDTQNFLERWKAGTVTIESLLPPVSKLKKETSGLLEDTSAYGDSMVQLYQKFGEAQSVLAGYQEKLRDLRLEELAATGETSLLLLEQANLAAERARAAVLARAETEEEKVALQGTADAAAEAASTAVYMADGIAKARAEAQALESAVAAVSRTLSALSSIGANIQSQIAIAKARIEALDAGASAEIAGRIETMNQRAKTAYEDALQKITEMEKLGGDAQQAQQDRNQALNEYNSALASTVELQRLLTEEEAKAKAIRDAEAAARRDAAAGRKETNADTKKQEDVLKYLTNLAAEVDFLKQTKDLFGEQLIIEQTLHNLRQQYGPEYVAGIEQQTRALLEQKMVLEQQKDLAMRVGQTIGNAFGNFLMDIVTGTENVADAFKKMAVQIINELFRILVVEKLVQSISKAVSNSVSGFFADGAAFSGGNVVPFARGGVVGSPTMFPMAGGRTGLMGEAGPEAIMPLKRGKNGKLGVEASGNVKQEAPVVNQKIINVLDPSIVNQYLSSREGEKVIMNVIRRNRAVA